MKRWSIFLAVILGMTNPTQSRHAQALQEDCMSKQDMLMGALCSGGVVMFSGYNMFTYDNYLFVSVLSIQDQTLSVGILGMVFVIGNGN